MLVLKGAMDEKASVLSDAKEKGGEARAKAKVKRYGNKVGGLR